NVFFQRSGTASINDYEPFLNFVTLQAGQASATVTVTPVADGVHEPDETLTIQLIEVEEYTAGTPASATVTIQYDLVARWHGDGDAQDSAGVNHGVLRNGAGFATGVSGQGFLLDGVDDYVRIVHSASLNLANAVTMELWF